MILFDTHFHYDRRTAVADTHAAIAADLALTGLPVKRLLLAAMGGSWQESLAAQEFAAASPDCCFSAGTHPHNAVEETRPAADFRTFFADPKCRAVGELGLDYYYDFSPRAKQLPLFEAFLAEALQAGLPAIVHCRDRDDTDRAYADTHALLKDFAAAGGRMVVHCFTGTPVWAERFLELGSYLGVTGMVTFNRAENIRETLRLIPLDRLLLETDSPYLAPKPHRGRQNSPGLLPLVAQRVAEERHLPPAELAAITLQNALRFYRWEMEPAS